MKLSDNTISVLKNFGSIYEGMAFKPGKVIKTISKGRDILAQCEIEEQIPQNFCIYDLNNFLGVLTLYKDTPTLSFEENAVVFSGMSGRSKMKYRFCPEELITIPPEKNVTMPDAEITFNLSKDDFEWIKNVNNVISANNVSVRSDGKTVVLVSHDVNNDGSSINELEVGTGNGDVYDMIFKTEALSKLYSESYEVKISSKGVAHFICKGMKLEYWLTTQNGSKFTKA